MYDAKWECRKCHYTKSTYYTDKDFNTIYRFNEFVNKSIHYCRNCKSLNMKIVNIVKE